MDYPGIGSTSPSGSIAAVINLSEQSTNSGQYLKYSNVLDVALYIIKQEQSSIGLINHNNYEVKPHGYYLT